MIKKSYITVLCRNNRYKIATEDIKRVYSYDYKKNPTLPQLKWMEKPIDRY